MQPIFTLFILYANWMMTSIQKWHLYELKELWYVGWRSQAPYIADIKTLENTYSMDEMFEICRTQQCYGRRVNANMFTVCNFTWYFEGIVGFPQKWNTLMAHRNLIPDQIWMVNKEKTVLTTFLNVKNNMW